jgi:hypothetical protein
LSITPPREDEPCRTRRIRSDLDAVIGAVDQMNVETRVARERRLPDIGRIAPRKKEIRKTLTKRGKKIGIPRIREHPLYLRYFIFIQGHGFS